MTDSPLKLFVARHGGTEKFTGGRLYINGEFECFTLEDEVREIQNEPVEKWKIKGQTAIPRGKYKVIISFSPRFGKRLPELLNVPGYVGVRIHPLNTAAQTEGCIGVGDDDPSDGFLGQSRAAFNRIFEKIQDALNVGEDVWITIE